MNRQVVLGEGATYAIPELEFEVPEKGQNIIMIACGDVMGRRGRVVYDD